MSRGNVRVSIFCDMCPLTETVILGDMDSTLIDSELEGLGWQVTDDGLDICPNCIEEQKLIRTEE